MYVLSPLLFVVFRNRYNDGNKLSVQHEQTSSTGVGVGLKPNLYSFIINKAYLIVFIRLLFIFFLLCIHYFLHIQGNIQEGSYISHIMLHFSGIAGDNPYQSILDLWIINLLCKPCLVHASVLCHLCWYDSSAVSSTVSTEFNKLLQLNLLYQVPCKERLAAEKSLY